MPFRLNQDKCRDLISFAAAEMRDAAEGRQVRPCPVLSALAMINPKKSDPGILYMQYVLHCWTPPQLFIYKLIGFITKLPYMLRNDFSL